MNFDEDEFAAYSFLFVALMALSHEIMMRV